MSPNMNQLPNYRMRLFPTGPLMDDHVDSPWHHKLVLRERVAGEYLGSWFILGDIDYVDEVIPLKDTRAAD